MSTLTSEASKMAPAQSQEQESKKRYALPRATIRQDGDGYYLKLEMPGVSKEGLEISVDNHEFTITGHRSDSEMKGEPVYREFRPMDYRRVFELDPTVDVERITARMEQGVVTLTLPKAEKLKPRLIPVGD